MYPSNEDEEEAEEEADAATSKCSRPGRDFARAYPRGRSRRGCLEVTRARARRAEPRLCACWTSIRVALRDSPRSNRSTYRRGESRWCFLSACSPIVARYEFSRPAPLPGKFSHGKPSPSPPRERAGDRGRDRAAGSKRETESVLLVLGTLPSESTRRANPRQFSRAARFRKIRSVHRVRSGDDDDDVDRTPRRSDVRDVLAMINSLGLTALVSTAVLSFRRRRDFLWIRHVALVDSLHQSSAVDLKAEVRKRSMGMRWNTHRCRIDQTSL